VIDEPLKEFNGQVYVEVTDTCAGKRHMKLQTGTAGKVDNNPRQRLVEWHISVTVTTNTSHGAHRLAQRVPNRDPHLLKPRGPGNE